MTMMNTREITYAHQIDAISLFNKGASRLYELCRLNGCCVRTDEEIEAEYAKCGGVESACREAVLHWQKVAADPWTACDAVTSVASRSAQAFRAKFGRDA